MNKINLLFLIYDLDRGGPEMRLLDFAKHFPQRAKINICVTSHRVALLKEFQECNVDIKILPIIKVYQEREKIHEISKYIAEKNITVVNTYDIKGLMIATYIKLFLNKTLKIIHHTVDLLHNYKLRHKAFLWFFLKFIDLSICNSSHSKNILKKTYINQHKIRVIHNGVDTEHYKQSSNQGSSLKKKYNIGKDEIILGTVSNFRKEKNYPFLLKAFAELRQQHNLVLLCIGGGKELNEMKKYATKLGIQEKVIFTGYSDRVADHLTIMDIFLLCSIKEGFPNGIIQAMSAGVPVIASAIGGCKEIIDNEETGLLFPVNDFVEFKFCVNRLLKNSPYALKMGQKGRMKVSEEFSMQSMIQNYLSSFIEVNTKI